MDDENKQKRSQTMSKIKSSGSKLENSFMALLKARDIDAQFERNVKDVTGKPDFVCRAHQVAIFIDSCFWHGCPKHLRRPSSNQDYWTQKIARNINRDRQVNQALKTQGWHIIRIWEHEFPERPSLKAKLTRLKRVLRAGQEVRDVGLPSDQHDERAEG